MRDQVRRRRLMKQQINQAELKRQTETVFRLLQQLEMKASEEKRISNKSSYISSRVRRTKRKE